MSAPITKHLMTPVAVTAHSAAATSLCVNDGSTSDSSRVNDASSSHDRTLDNPSSHISYSTNSCSRSSKHDDCYEPTTSCKLRASVPIIAAHQLPPTCETSLHRCHAQARTPRRHKRPAACSRHGAPAPGPTIPVFGSADYGAGLAPSIPIRHHCTADFIPLVRHQRAATVLRQEH